MAEPKTRRTDDNVDEYLATVGEPRRSQAGTVREIMTRVTGQPAVMWGNMIGFGDRNDGGPRSHDWFVLGFAPRAAALTIYGVRGAYDELAASDRLGRHTTGKGCLYFRSLDGVDLAVLESVVTRAWEQQSDPAQ